MPLSSLDLLTLPWRVEHGVIEGSFAFRPDHAIGYAYTTLPEPIRPHAFEAQFSGKLRPWLGICCEANWRVWQFRAIVAAPWIREQEFEEAAWEQVASVGTVPGYDGAHGMQALWQTGCNEIGVFFSEPVVLTCFRCTYSACPTD